MKLVGPLAASIIFSLVMTACGGEPPPTLTDADLLSTAEILRALTALAETAIALPIGAPTATLEPAKTGPLLVGTSTPDVRPPVEVRFIEIAGDAEAQLRIKVAEPFIMYYRDLTEHPQLIRITFSLTSGIPDYPYQAEAIFDGGVSSGWLILVPGGNIDWWVPECMTACPFSDEFRTTYPEIVAGAGG